MKKFLTKILCLILACGLALTVVGCNENTNTNNNENKPLYKGDDLLEETSYDFDDGLPDEEIADSTTELYNLNKEFKTDYKIVIPASSQKNAAETKGASEIMFFMGDATGIAFDIIRDSEISDGSLGGKYISVGDTKLFKESGLENDENYNVNVLGNDGYMIVTYDDTIILNAVGGNGKVYSAYGFLERNMGYRYYAEDEWAIDKDAVKMRKDMYVVDVPDFNSRYLDTAVVQRDMDYIVRMRQHGGQNAGLLADMEGGGWVGGDESLCYQYLYYKDYFDDHKEWYSGLGDYKTGQLCMTTTLANELDKGVRPFDLLFEHVLYGVPGVVTGVATDSSLRVVMFGINDNPIPCNCPDCTALSVQIKHSGIMCLFMNELIKRRDEWQASLPASDPNKTRKIKFAFFAYQHNIEPPTNYNMQTGKYEVIPYDYDGDGDYNDLVLHEDIIVRIAPSGSGNLHPHSSEDRNVQAYVAFNGWGQIASTLAIWDYGTSFKDYLAPYPDYTSMQDNFIYYRAMGVEEILTQLPAHTDGSAFHDLKTYLRGQLMWNVDQDVEWLIKDYMEHYYGKGAADVIWEYLTYTRLYSQSTTTDIKIGDKIYYGFDNGGDKIVFGDGDYYEVYSDGYYYPQTTVKFFEKFFPKAIEALNNNKDLYTDKEYEKYYNRIQIESLYWRYLNLKFFFEAENPQTKVMIDEFEYYAGIAKLTQFNHAGKNGTMQVEEFIADCRAKLVF